MRASISTVEAAAPLEWRASHPCPPGAGCIDLWLLDLESGGGDGEQSAAAWLHALLAAACGAAGAQLRLWPGVGGKPVIEGEKSLFFNWSRSKGTAICAIASRDAGPVGVDIERQPLNPAIGWQSIALRRFAAADCSAIAALPESSGRAAFLKLWTRQEAILKASGLGLAGSVREPLGVQARSGQARSGGVTWRWCDVELPSGYAATAALAHRGPDRDAPCG